MGEAKTRPCGGTDNRTGFHRLIPAEREAFWGSVFPLRSDAWPDHWVESELKGRSTAPANDFRIINDIIEKSSEKLLSSVDSHHLDIPGSTS